MTKKYTFICIDSDSGQETAVVLNTEDETWQPPVDTFFNFLKGTGFLFSLEEELAVVNCSTGDIRERL